MRILVADDDASLRALVTMQLELEGHEVVTAQDGEQVLARAVDDRPDVLVLDVTMPGLGGPQVLVRLRAEHPDERLPAVLLTGHEPGDLDAALAGVRDVTVLRKPHDEADLLAAVARAEPS